MWYNCLYRRRIAGNAGEHLAASSIVVPNYRHTAAAVEERDE